MHTFEPIKKDIHCGAGYGHTDPQFVIDERSAHATVMDVREDLLFY